jgi:hypothetical protein
MNYALKAASTNGFLGIAKALLARKNIDPSYDDDICFRTACEKGTLDEISLS